MYDLVALGESLIDFTPCGTSATGSPLYCQNPGGAPANVLSMAAKLGCQTAFIGKVGADSFGDFLCDTMRASGIGIAGALRDPVVPTTLAFVHLEPDGARSFSFYRSPGADMMLRADELPADLLRESRIFHFGGVSLTDEPVRSATYAAVSAAHEAGSFISFDPNFRPLLWRSSQSAIQELRQAAAYANLIKVSEEEMMLLTGCNALAQGAAMLRKLGPATVIITCGAHGAFVSTAQTERFVPTYAVDTIDTTGAGDAFVGALLWQLSCLEDLHAIADFSAAKWCEILRFSNAAGSLTTTRKGAIPALPDKQEILHCMRTAKPFECVKNI